MAIRRGDIYYANLNPAIGSEQAGVRPVVIIQNNLGNEFSPTTIVAPITSQKKSSMLTHVPITDIPKLSPNVVALLEQVRTIDCSRLERFLGHLPDEQMWDIDRAYAIAIGIAKMPNPPMLMALCGTCAQKYYDMPDRTIRRADYLQDSKSSCNLCQVRQGWDFLVYDK